MTDRQRVVESQRNIINCQTALAELLPETRNPFQTKLAMRIHSPPLPAAAAASLARPRSYQQTSTLTPSVWPTNKPMYTINFDMS